LFEDHAGIPDRDSTKKPVAVERTKQEKKRRRRTTKNSKK
jgi:hypothetical protein